MVEHHAVAEDQRGCDRHRAPGCLCRGAGDDDAVTDHEEERSDHAVLLDGDGVDEVAAIDEVDGGEVLGREEDEHLEAEQHALRKTHLVAGEGQPRAEQGESEGRDG